MTIDGERKYDNSQKDAPVEDLSNSNVESNPNVETKAEEKGIDQKNKQQKDNEFYRKERFHGKFSQSVVLPDDIDQDLTKIAAKYEDGVLSISVPKKETMIPKHHQIEIM